MSADDKRLWSDYAARVRRMQKAQPATSPLEGEVGAHRRGDGKVRGRTVKQKSGIAERPLPQPLPCGGGEQKLFAQPALFDRRTERALRQGDVALDGRLDLHGMTQAKAHAALATFIARHLAAGSRKLLVITGQGRGGTGVLKTSLPGWLAALPHAGTIIDLRPAALKHGGAGAWYVWLKKSK